MSIFKCKHPFNKLIVEKGLVVKKIDKEFNKCEIKMKCSKCGESIFIRYAELSGSVDDFLSSKTKGENNE